MNFSSNYRVKISNRHYMSIIRDQDGYITEVVSDRYCYWDGSGGGIIYHDFPIEDCFRDGSGRGHGCFCGSGNIIDTSGYGEGDSNLCAIVGMPIHSLGVHVHPNGPCGGRNGKFDSYALTILPFIPIEIKIDRIHR